MLIEIIVTNKEEAILAEKYGADRLELIHDFALGGLSPTLSVTEDVCKSVKLPVHVMLRPHGNSFIYNDNDIKQIMQELDYIRDKTQAAGIVFGALDSNSHLDTKLLENVIRHKGHLKLAFHRAIDISWNTLEAYKRLLEYPEIDIVLSSGGMPTALEGANIISQMVELSNSVNHCQVLAGSGITPDNAQEIIAKTNVSQIHLGTGVRTNSVLDEVKFKKLISILP